MPKPEKKKSQYSKYSEFLDQSIRGNKTVGNHVSSLKNLNETLKKLNKEIEKCYEKDKKGDYKPIGEERLTKIKNLYKLCDHFASIAENDAGRNGMNGTLVKELHRILKRDEEHVNCLFATDIFPETFRRNVVTTSAFNMVKPVGGQMSSRYPVTYKDENGKEVYGFFTADSHFDVNLEYDKLGIYSKAGIKNGSNITDRNCAMTRIANLLGVNDLIAESHPMTILDVSDEENKLKKDGVFMATAKGISYKDVCKKEEYKDGFDHGLGFASVKKNIADMQILDYICGNIDRHLNNITYIFDVSNTLVGIQGIDNDLSMGTIDPGENKKISHLPCLSNMFAISKSMADKVKDLTKESLEYVLKGLNLSNDEIEAAWKRTQNVKEKIKKEPYNTPNDFDYEGLTVVDDLQWSEIPIESLCTKLKVDVNLFDYIVDIPNDIEVYRNREKEKENGRKKWNANSDSTIKNTVPNNVSFAFSDSNDFEEANGIAYADATLTTLSYTNDVIRKNTNSLEGFIRRLERSATNPKTGKVDLDSRTKKFNKVYKAAKAIIDWYNKYDEKTDKSELKKLYENAAKACQKYINNRNPYSELGKERQKIVTDMMEFIGTQGVMINEYHEYVAAEMNKKEGPAKEGKAPENEKAPKDNGNLLI